MSIIARIVLGVAAGLLASALTPGRSPRGFVLACIIGIAGALLGGWGATRLFRLPLAHGFFNLPTWMTGIAAASVLLLVFSRAASAAGRSGQRMTRRWPG